MKQSCLGFELVLLCAFCAKIIITDHAPPYIIYIYYITYHFSYKIVRKLQPVSRPFKSVKILNFLGVE